MSSRGGARPQSFGYLSKTFETCFYTMLTLSKFYSHVMLCVKESFHGKDRFCQMNYYKIQLNQIEFNFSIKFRCGDFEGQVERH